MRDVMRNVDKVSESEFSEVTLARAEANIRAFLADGAKRTGDLEDGLCGDQNLWGVLLGVSGLLDTWFESPFFPALARMVESGEVTWHRDEETEFVWYRLAGKDPAPGAPGRAAEQLDALPAPR